MFEGIKKWLEEQSNKRRINQIRNKRRIWDFGKHSGWGDSIQLSGKFEDRRIYGFLSSPQISNGDELRIPLKDGNVYVCAVINVKYQNDPHDMFFADLVDVGYLSWLEKQEVYTNKPIDDSKSMFLLSF